MIWFIGSYILSGIFSARFMDKTWLAWSKAECDGRSSDLILPAFIFGPLGILATLCTFESKYWTLK